MKLISKLAVLTLCAIFVFGMSSCKKDDCYVCTSDDPVTFPEQEFCDGDTGVDDAEATAQAFEDASLGIYTCSKK